MMLRRGRWLSLGLVLVILLSMTAACSQKVDIIGALDEPSVLAFPMEITDQAGRAVKIEQLPETIVSLAPSNTEIVYALGLEDRLLGVTEYCDYPEAAQEKPKVGGFSDVDIEQVVALDPDLILATSMHLDEVTPHLERLGFTVLTLDPANIDQVLDAIIIIGLATGRDEMAFSIKSVLKKRIEAVTDLTDTLTDAERPRVFYILWHDPLMTVSSESIINELITRAGGVNIAAELEGEYPTIDLEVVLMADPEVIIVGSGHGSGEDAPYEFALTEPRLAEVAARQNDRIYEIDADLASRPCPRMVVGLETMANLIHPELFEDGADGD